MKKNDAFDEYNWIRSLKAWPQLKAIFFSIGWALVICLLENFALKATLLEGKIYLRSLEKNSTGVWLYCLLKRCENSWVFFFKEMTKENTCIIFFCPLVFHEQKHHLLKGTFLEHWIIKPSCNKCNVLLNKYQNLERLKNV